MKKIWPFSFYFLYFAALASLQPFFVIFFQGLGYNGIQIGLLTGAAPLITLVAAPFGTALADSTLRHKLVMGLGLVSAIIMALVLPALKSFTAVFALIAIYTIFMAPVGSLADSATMTMLGKERTKYGRIRLGGTFGWGMFAPIAGLFVQNYGLKIAFWMFAVISLANLFVSQKFDYGKQNEQTSSKGGIQILLKNKHWVFFLVTSFLGGVGVFSAASYLYPYMAELGATETQMGIASLIATLTEIPIFFFGHHLIKRFTSHRLFIAALAMMGIRSLLLAVAATPLTVFAIQILGGMTFPAMWLAGVTYTDENAPAGLKSTAQGLFSAASFGFGSAVGGFIGGVLLESIGGQRMFFVLGILILVLLVLFESARRLVTARAIAQIDAV